MSVLERKVEAARAKRLAMTDALRELVAACEYVKPIAGAVATKASVKDIRQAGRFMAALENAKKILEE